MATAIVCGAGGYRTVFIHGVLSAFEDEGFRVDAYGGTSAAGLTSVAASVGMCNVIGSEFWLRVLERKYTAERGMSDVMLANIEEWSAPLQAEFFRGDVPRYIIPASFVKNEEAAAMSQDLKSARRLGRRILLSAARGERSEWVDENLESHVFDTAPNAEHPLTPENFDEVMYATTRMLHAWDVAGWIGGKPYVDASYLCSIPAIEMAERGYDDIIAISADPPGKLYRDIFQSEEITSEYKNTKIHVIMADYDPGPAGADFTDATNEGLITVYHHGKEKGRAFLNTWK